MVDRGRVRSRLAGRRVWVIMPLTVVLLSAVVWGLGVPGQSSSYVGIEDDANVLNGGYVQQTVGELPIGITVWTTDQGADDPAGFQAAVTAESDRLGKFPVPVLGVNAVSGAAALADLDGLGISSAELAAIAKTVTDSLATGADDSAAVIAGLDRLHTALNSSSARNSARWNMLAFLGFADLVIIFVLALVVRQVRNGGVPSRFRVALPTDDPSSVGFDDRPLP